MSSETPSSALSASVCAEALLSVGSRQEAPAPARGGRARSALARARRSARWPTHRFRFCGPKIRAARFALQPYRQEAAPSTARRPRAAQTPGPSLCAAPCRDAGRSAASVPSASSAFAPSAGARSPLGAAVGRCSRRGRLQSGPSRTRGVLPGRNATAVPGLKARAGTASASSTAAARSGGQPKSAIRRFFFSPTNKSFGLPILASLWRKNPFLCDEDRRGLSALGAMESKINLAQVAPVNYKVTAALVNQFVVSTTQFLNRFVTRCDRKLHQVGAKMHRIEVRPPLPPRAGGGQPPRATASDHHWAPSMATAIARPVRVPAPAARPSVRACPGTDAAAHADDAHDP
jgi:hypothetical protein